MDPEPPRLVMAVSAAAGGVFYGMVHLTTTLMAGQPVHRADLIRAAANVLMAILSGALVAYFLGPAIASYVPVAALREPYALGFGIGAGAFEVAPFAYRLLRARAAKIVKEKRG